MWISRRELRRMARELSEAKTRADSNEQWARGLVNSVLTARAHQGVSVSVPEKKYTPTPVLPDVVQGWAQAEFVEELTKDGTYNSQAEALEAFKQAQKTGAFPYQSEQEFLT